MCLTVSLTTWVEVQTKDRMGRDNLGGGGHLLIVDVCLAGDLPAHHDHAGLGDRLAGHLGGGGEEVRG